MLDRLDLNDAPGCFADIDVARAAASFLRTTKPARAIQASPRTFLDDPGRFIIARFLEKLAEDSREFIVSVTPAGTLRRG